MPSGSPSNSFHRGLSSPAVRIGLAALLASLPLILHGGSCGQDIAFHIQSWLDAATQLRHGHYPHWAFTPAWNAGEPRFLFYPPLSWLLGALLTTIFPIAACPVIFLFLALLAAGLTFYHLVRRLLEASVSTNAALLAAALYLANPYMLFTAFERSAYAELLAAAWIPLLLLAILRPRPTLRGIAIPLALLWLTNAPAAVIGSYTLAFVATLRLLNALRPSLRSTLYPLLSVFLAGTTLGLALPAFYLLPAASERKYIQVAMAILPNMRFQDNFLFTRTADAAHNAVNYTASTLALTLLLLTAATLLTLFILTALRRKPSVLSTKAKRSGETPAFPPHHRNAVILSERSESKDPEGLPPTQTANLFPTMIPTTLSLPYTLTFLTILITLLLTPISTPIWQHLPNLAFLQFPWRLLILLTPTLALSLALLFNNLPRGPRWTPNLWTLATLTLPLVLGLLAFHLYAQACDPTDDPATLAHLLATHHGTLPTDEYTPLLADNDILRTDNPGYWLLPNPSDNPANPNTPAPHTLPTASELNPSLDTDDTPIPDAQTLSTPAPRHVTLHITQPSILVLNLRAYPSWHITDTSNTISTITFPPAQDRNDGLLAITLARPGNHTIDIRWRRTHDQTLGLALSLAALFALALTFRKQAPGS